MSQVIVSPVLQRAPGLARQLLYENRRRWLHTIGVAARAQQLAGAVGPEDRQLLIAAAWLHDIGYSALAADTGLHSVDGARFLRTHQWPLRLCALVAHHSGARFVAAELGFAGELAEFVDEESAVTDALAFADQTTGPDGRQMDIGERMAGMLARHGPNSVQARVHHLRGPYLVGAANRVQAQLASAG